MEDVYLSLGSNIGNREAFLEQAIEALGSDPRIMIEKQASLYETSPVGGVKQRAFVNTAVKIGTTYEPLTLLKVIHEIESGLHRTRQVHWGPRTVDIDIIFFGNEQIDQPGLSVPHPEAFNRLFVLIPIQELIDEQFPDAEKIATAIKSLQQDDQSIKKISPANNFYTEITSNVTNVLAAISDDPTRKGLIETPDRVARMYANIFDSIGLEDFQDYKLFDSPESDDSKTVMVKGIPFYSMCEHHMMPFWGKVSVAYVPDNGKIIGLSKIPRLVDFVSHKLSLQEKITDDVLSQMEKILHPKGVAVIVDARHMCIEMRGVKKTGTVTRTTKFTGVFQQNDELRSEFLNSIQVGQI
ncbi:GTP cyclohydrolase I [Lentilactobacillus buchneri subsp. silagei]|uniref:GTP cyclohydrolase I FolE n=1 Tax=Lentilactobacillus buchneri TaxID=1581 RepID=UPI0012E49A86|nr:GTP cyclohydrolase I FolE [Lentilactobacillus buchneri]GED94477.1 GTP cyclohydrolase I [Lentilactobacillus buchneri subsp. silagei]